MPGRSNLRLPRPTHAHNGYVGLVQTQETYDAIVVGGGPAGLSAAEILGRSCRSVLVLDDGRPRNAASYRLSGFLSRDGTPPQQLLAIARRELAKYPSVVLRDAHASAAQREGETFRVDTGDGSSFSGRRLLLATGVYDALPDIPGLADEWGKRVFVCPYCDAWEVRGKRLGVIGRDGSAQELARELRQWSSDLVVCAQDSVASVESAGEQPLQMHLKNGGTESCDAIFLCVPLRQRSPLVDMLGCKRRDDGHIEVDAYGRTSVPGCYAAGDAAARIHQVVLAAASGVAAGIGINEDLVERDAKQVVDS